MSWSDHFQSPYYLERTRTAIYQPEYFPLIRKWCGVGENKRILDVGCGSGFFSRVLASGNENVSVMGIDLDKGLIEYARTKAKDLPGMDFFEGDALHLPFKDREFDAVTSHTFLTSVNDPAGALKEMIRVLKPGGILSCIVAMNFENACSSPGHYPGECTWHKEFELLYHKLWRAYELIDPVSNYAGGLKPSETPGFFAEHGLLEVSAYPIGKLFSFSNEARTRQDRLEWLTLYKKSEEERLKAYMSLPGMRSLFSPDEAGRYMELLDEKCRYLKDHIGENRIWEWSGGVNMLVRGIKNSEEGL